MAQNLGSLVLKTLNDAEEQSLPGITEFMENPRWGLNLNLFPAQRVILKAHYGLELDDKRKHKYWKSWRLEDQWHFTEKEYLSFLFEEGRSNLKEVIPGLQRREMVLAVGRRSGKCFTGETLVLTDQGLIRGDALGDPEGPEVQPVSLGVAQEGPASRSQSTQFYNGGVKPVRRITTRCGYQLAGTDNHRIRILSRAGKIQWGYFADLQAGDQVCVHRGTDLWASDYLGVKPHWTTGGGSLLLPERLTEKWGLLLGLLAGDENGLTELEMSVAAPDISTGNLVEGLWDSLFGPQGEPPPDLLTRVRLSSVVFRGFLHNLGWPSSGVPAKKPVPWSILKSPRPVVKAFLRGMFETGGSVSAKGEVISLHVAGKTLAAQTQLLLLNMGMVSEIQGAGQGPWLLNLVGLSSRRKFAEEIGFFSPKKQALLLSSFRGGTDVFDTETIPHQRPWCPRLSNLPPSGNAGATFPQSSGQVTYACLAEHLALAIKCGEDPGIIYHFEALIQTDYFFDPIEAIDESEERVYDLHVPDGHSFVANGMTNHNTFLSAGIMTYESARLLRLSNPQNYFKFPSGELIQLLVIATTKKQASILYNKARGFVAECELFHPYLANKTQTFMKFQTPRDVELYGSYKDDEYALASIQMTFSPCKASGLRGDGNYVLVLDEVAHFQAEGLASPDSIMAAVEPSMATFSPKRFNEEEGVLEPTGDVESRLIQISSPMGKDGYFWNRFQMGMSDPDIADNMLCIQAPTWEINPTVPYSWYIKEYKKDPRRFLVEYGAQFSDRSQGWIESARDLTDCIDPKAKRRIMGKARKPHFMGIDIALKGDPSAIAIGHLDDKSKIVLDVVDWIQAGVDEHRHVDRLDFEGVADWVNNWTRKFFIVDGIFDQWAGIPFEQALERRGQKKLRKVHFTDKLNSEYYANFKNMMFAKRLLLYDDPIPEDEEHCDYIRELLRLQAEHRRKDIIIVSAPKIKGAHDDLSDAVVRMVWCASQKSAHSNIITSAHRGNVALRAESLRLMNQFKRQRGGTSPKRTILKPRRRR